MAQLQTSTVSGNLNVTGSLAVTGSSTFLSTLSGTSAQFVAITCSNFSPAITASPAGATNQIQFNSGSVLTADPNFVWDNANDRLGVGTSAPNFTLSVTGTLGVSDASVIDVSSTSAALRVTQRGTGESLRIEDSTNPDSTPFVISSTGQVGIGTGSPQSRMHISGTGDVRIEGGSDLVISSTSQNFNGRIRFIDTGSNPRATLYAGGTDTFRIADSTIDRFIINSAGNIGIGTDSTQAGFARLVVRPQAGNIIGLTQVSNTSSIVAWNDSGVSNTLRVAGNPLVFTGNGGSGAEHMRISTDGNVGIGTTSPSALLSVKGAGTGIVDIGQWSAGNNYGAIYLNGDFAVNNNYNILSSPTDKRLLLNRPTGEDICFRMNNVDQMTLDINGRLGIGIAGPLQALDVVGSMRLSTGNIYRPDNAGVALQLGNGTNTHYGTHVFFNAAGTSERARITDGGNVGIGTTSPTSLLHVNGDTIVAGDLAVNGGDITSTAGSDFRITPSGSFARLIIKPVATNQQAWLQLDATGENAVINALTADQLSIRINNTERMTINAAASTFNNIIAADGGSITSTAATLNINAGGTVNIDDNTKVTGSLTIRTGDGKSAVLAMSNGNGYRASLSAVSDNPAGFTGFDFNAHGDTVAKINYGAPANDDLTFELKTFNNAAIGPNFVFSTSTGQKWRLKSDSGNLGFFNALDVSELQLSQTGDLSLGGNLLLQNGAAISFANTTPDGTGASNISELLDDYEEGTWTPVLASSGTPAGLFTYTAQNGTYTKIGNIVHVSGYVDINTIVTSPGAGDFRITGLPFTVANTPNGNTFFLTVAWQGLTVSANVVLASFADSGTHIDIYRTVGGTQNSLATTMSPADFGTGGIRFNGTYRVG